MTETLNTMVPGVQPGDRLAHFEVREQLPAGGMGIVWRGYDRLLGRGVAIKQVAEAGAVDEAFREKFRREAVLQKRISADHPNIVKLVDALDDPRGLFLVTEYVDGPSLEAVLNGRPGPIEPLAALRIVRDAAAGLVGIHAAGVVHRDLKPGNILIPREGPARVCDFGLAALMAEQDTMEMGTARYMAPEMFGGEIDGRADIYSLGVIAYEMLAGRPAFEEAFKAVLRDRRRQALRWMKWHTNLKVAAPPLTGLNDQVPPVLAELVERMMAKDPTRRIASAEDLLEAIRLHFSKTAVAARAAAPDPGAAGAAAGAADDQPTAPLPKRGRLVPVLAALLAVQAVGIGGYLWYDHAQKREAWAAVATDARERFDAALALYDEGEIAEAGAAFGQVADTMGDRGTLGVGARGYALLSAARLEVEAADAAMGEDRFEDAAAVYRRGRELLDRAAGLGLPAQASVLADRIDRLRRDAVAGGSFVAEAGVIAAAIADGRFDDARRRERDLRQVAAGEQGAVLKASEQRKLEELANRIEDQQLQAHKAAVEAEVHELLEAGEPAEARAALERALDRLGSDGRLRDLLRQAERAVNFREAIEEGREAEDRGDLAGAVAAYGRAHRIEAEPVIGRHIAELRGRLAFERGRELERAGNLSGAARLFTEALGHDPDHADAQDALNRVAAADQKQTMLAAAEAAVIDGDYDQAVNLYERALELSPDAATRQGLREARLGMHQASARAAMERGDLDSAGEALARALEIDADDARTGRLRADLEDLNRYHGLIEEADTLRAESKFAEARRAYRRAIEAAEEAELDPAEAERRLEDAEFDQLIAHARSAMQRGVWPQARAWLRTAENVRPGDARVEQLLAEVDENAQRE